MQSHQKNNRWLRRSVLRLSLLLVICGLAIGLNSECVASDGIYASVLEIKGIIQSQAPDGKAESVKPGDLISIGDKLNLGQESWVVLMMADSTIRKFSGPATITIKEESKGDDENILTRLGSAIVELLFAREEEVPEVAMVTRRLPDWLSAQEEKKTSILLLVHPAPHSALLSGPSQFEWRGVEGISLYRVSVYSWDNLMWQGTTSHSSISCPEEQCHFEPGGEYYWMVEGLVGNSALRSKSAKFRILTPEVGTEIRQVLSSKDLSVAAKANLFLNLRLYDQALSLIDSHWGQTPSDPEAFRLRAEIKGMMGLFEDAYFDYFRADQIAPGN
jgi:hypothetical protein